MQKQQTSMPRKALALTEANNLRLRHRKLATGHRCDTPSTPDFKIWVSNA
jgi:hypothetical protein